MNLQEIKEGRSVGKAELYRATHTKKDGKPVNTFAGLKIVSTHFCTLNNCA